MGRVKRDIESNPLINKDGSISARLCSMNDFVTLYGVSSKTMHTWIASFREALGERKT
jgi:hypothetical protein